LDKKKKNLSNSPRDRGKVRRTRGGGSGYVTTKGQKNIGGVAQQGKTERCAEWGKSRGSFEKEGAANQLKT